MEWVVKIVVLVAAAWVAHASECSDQLGGVCYHGDFRGCPRGYNRYSLSGCGFQGTCCYNNHTTTSSHTTHSPSSSLSCGTSLVNSNHRIIGGVVTQPHEYPWQLSLRYNGQHLCGATLIDRQWVLTAAHCFKDLSLSTYHWTVGVGLHDLRYVSSSSIRSVAHIYRHPSYNPTTSHNDITLLKLNIPLDITGTAVRTACLPDQHDSFDGHMCTITGWGSTTVVDGPASRYLMEADIPVMGNNVCSYYLGYSAHIQQDNLCAGLTRGGKDTCQGDSGGPLTCRVGGVWKVAGVVSWGYGCGEQYSPGVYTRVSAFLSWIHSITAAHGGLIG